MERLKRMRPMWHVTLYALAGMAAFTGHWGVAAAAAAGGAAYQACRRKAGGRNKSIGGEGHG